MKVFVTGASGFVGSAVVQELIKHGHQVIGLARSEESAEKVKNAGAEVLRGGLEDIDILKKGAESADAVIHTAFIHDFSQYDKSAVVDKNAIEAMGAVLKGTQKPIIITGGLGLVKPKGDVITENDKAPENKGNGIPRVSEAAGLALAKDGIKASVIRLPPSVHGKGDHGFIPYIINVAREKGTAAYQGDGENKWSAVHRLDAAVLYRLAIEKGASGKLYNAVGDAGIPMHEIAKVIGEVLNVPVRSVTAEESAAHFGWMSRFITMEARASAEQTEKELGWKPTHIGLIEDMKQNYFGK